MKPSFLLPLLGAATAMILSSCSTSRTVDQDLTYETGSVQRGSILESDLLIASGAAVEVSYLSGCRVFLERGSTLTGLNRGAKNSTLYYESGASFPQLRSIRYVEVEDARDAYQTRFSSLLPARAEAAAGSGGYSRTRVGLGVGGIGYGHYYGGLRRYHRHSRHSQNHSSRIRAVSVKPKSYRAKR